MAAAYPLGLIQSSWNARRELARGAIVGKRYQVDRLLGTGASGEVWDAEDLATGTRVALKKLRTGRVGHELSARFRREAQLYARLDSRRVARLLDVLADPCFGAVQVLERVDGEPLSELLNRKNLNVEEAIELGLDLLLGVADLHRHRVVHRDLKPANVLLRGTDGGRHEAVIVDLGAGRTLGREGGEDDDDDLTSITRGPMVIGTLAYLAPEQLIDSRAVSPAADLYAVGTILYRAVVGTTPFAGLPQLELIGKKRTEEAPMLVTGRSDARAHAFEELLVTALRRRSSERYLSAEDMREALLAARSQPGPDEAVEPASSQAPPPLAEAEYRNLHEGARRNGHEGARRDFDSASREDTVEKCTTNFSVPLRVPLCVPLRVIPVLRPWLPDPLPRDASPPAPSASSRLAPRVLRCVALSLMVLTLLLVFLRWRSGANPGLRARRVAPASALVDPRPEASATASAAPDEALPPVIAPRPIARPATKPQPPRRPAPPAPTTSAEAPEADASGTDHRLDKTDPWAAEPGETSPRELPPMR